MTNTQIRTADREAGNLIEQFDTLEEALLDIQWDEFFNVVEVEDGQIIKNLS